MAAATTIAAVGVGVSAAGAGASFIQAAKQQNLQRKAEAAAEQAMAEARKKLEVNFYDQLSINKEPYELQREALLSQGAQAIAAAQEGERNVGATAGRVAMAQNEAQGQIRTAMGKEMQDLERLSATEESRLRDINVQIDMERAKGAQLAARDAQRQAAQATQQGIAGVQNAAQQFLTSFVPLYAKQGASPTAPGHGVLQSGMNPAPDFGPFGDLSKSYTNYQSQQQLLSKQLPLGFGSAMSPGQGVLQSGMNMDTSPFGDYLNRSYAPSNIDAFNIYNSGYNQNFLPTPYRTNQ
jgi:hypothetical protein